jgi:hypothetical protein
MTLNLVSEPCVRLGVIAAVCVASLGILPTYAAVPEVTEPPFFSGQVSFGQTTVEPAFDDVTGNIVFLLTPNGAPLPSEANPAAQENFYQPIYPLSSTIPADELNCQTSNCNHAHVLGFANPNYDSNSADLAGTSKACTDFNGGKPCTVYKGHDHLVGVPSTGGNFNVAWHVSWVLFTPQGFADGAINMRIKTLDELDALLANGDAVLVPRGVFNCQIVSQTVYNRGVPLTFVFP